MLPQPKQPTYLGIKARRICREAGQVWVREYRRSLEPEQRKKVLWGPFDLRHADFVHEPQVGIDDFNLPGIHVDYGEPRNLPSPYCDRRRGWLVVYLMNNDPYSIPYEAAAVVGALLFFNPELSPLPAGLKIRYYPPLPDAYAVAARNE